MDAVRHRFTVEEYRKMGEAGIFHEDDRVELIGGEIVEMAAIGKRHFESVYRLTRLLSRWVFVDAPSHYGGAEAERLGVSVQNPLAIAIDGEPQPDLVLLRRSEGSARMPTPEEALLVVEVADTYLAYDRETKLPLYAGAGIPEAWLVDLTTDEIEVYSEPGPGGYGKLVRFGRAERVVSVTLPGLAFDASEALPPEG
jgi:Uma2 family endonuclease